MFKDYIVNKLTPPGIEKPNRRKIFNILIRLGNLMGEDATQVLKNFFPLLSDSKALSGHGSALSIPRYVNDTEEAFRSRVAAGAFFIKERGNRSFFRTAIAQQFAGRELDIKEEYMKLFIQLDELSAEDKAWLYEFLTAELDPNILIALVSEEKLFDEFDIQDEAQVEVRRQDIDLFDWGLCFDGQVLAGTAECLCFDGTAIADGSYECGQIITIDATYTGYRQYDLYFNGTVRADGSFDFKGFAELPVQIPDTLPVFEEPDDSLTISIVHS